MAARWETIAPRLETLAGELDATILPGSRAGIDDPLARVFGRVQESRERLEIHEEIARGGMGVLRRARQRSVGRDVALKSVRPDRTGEVATRKLLDEAWIAGRLEHPNIVPVYDVELMQGEPHVLMQRIEGQAWSTLLGDASEVERRFGEPDLLEWNLQILMQVATALHYAHSRHVLHLDVKPENVMIGAFGQVYLLDWGVALLMDAADDSLALPRVSNRQGIVGTPGYMAPEMVDETPMLGPATDVYLLGATLFHLLAGRPPHHAKTVVAALHKALFATPARPEGVPDELWEVCAKAMSPKVEDRFGSAEAFRLAVAQFMRHRGSVQVSDQAHGQLERLEAVVTSDAPDKQIQSLHSAARFGFQHALTIWPGNEAAKRGLRRTILAVAEHELAHGEPEAAQSLVSELDAVPGDVEVRIHEGLERKRREAERMTELSRLGGDFDLSVGQRTRWFLTMIFGVFAVVGPLLAQAFADRPLVHEPAGYIVMPLVLLGLFLGLGYWARDSMTRSKINFRYGVVILLLFPIQIVLVLVASAKGEDPISVIPSLCLTWCMTAAIFGMLIDRRALPTALVYLAANVLTSLYRESTFIIVAISNLLMTINVVWMWWPERVFDRRHRSSSGGA